MKHEKGDRFRSLIEGLNVITYEYIVNEQCFSYVSRMAEAITGYATEEWLKSGFWESHIYPDDKKWIKKYNKQQTGLLNDYEYELRFICADGSVKWFKDITTVSAPDGFSLKQVGVLIDISERKKYEAELKENKEKYQALIEQQTEMITRWKPDGTFTYVNDVFCEFFNKSRDELLGRKFIPPMPLEDLERFSKFFSQLDKDNPVGQFTHRVIMPEGSIRWLRWTDTAIFDEHGNISEYQTVGRDITARKKAEDALRQSEEKYRRLIENTNVIAWEFDSEKKKFLYVSQQAERILGYTLSEWYKEHFWYEILHNEDKAWAKKFSNEKISLGESHEFEYRVVARDGSVKWFRDITTVDRYKDATRLHGILIDITDRKLIEEKSRQNELQLSLLFENAPIGMSLNSIDGRFLKVNSSLCKTLGYTKDELLNMESVDITHPDDLETDRFLLKKCIDEYIPTYNLTKKYIRKDGEIVYASLHVSILNNEQGIPHQLIAQVVDITEKKKAEDKLRETEFRLSTVINNLPNIIFYEGFDGKARIADNVINILGYSPEELSSDKELFLNLIHPEDNAKIERGEMVWNQVYDKGYHKKEYRIKNRAGQYLWFEDLMYLVKGRDKNHVVGFMIDVTERKEKEEKLMQTQARLSAVLNNLSNVAIYEYGEEVNFISENINDILGYPSSDFMNDKEFFSSLIVREEIQKYDERVVNWLKNGSKGVLSSIIKVKNKSGEIKWLEDHMFKVTPKNGKPYFSGIMIDITKQKEAEAKFQETESRLSAILTNLPKVVIYQAMNGRDFISDNIQDMIGYTPDEVLKNKYFFGNLMPEEDIKKVKNQLSAWHSKNDEGILVMEFRLRKKNGEFIWVEDHMFRVKTGDGNSYLSGILIDVTERKAVEQKINQSLKEKELLLKEIHHRVKNNLQVVSSLLKLQSSYITDKNTYDILLDSQNRVRSMALVHQKLYQSKNFSQIDFREYVRQLSMQLFNVFKHKSKDILIEVTSKGAYLSLDLAIPCGLIINELVSNSLKYAFPENCKGKISIEINSLNNTLYELILKDNGIGFPAEIDFRNTSTLGLQLVNTLVGQIEGNIEMENCGGTKFIIRFKKSASKTN